MSDLLDQFRACLTRETVVGLVGVGVFGASLREIAEAIGCQVLLCDPPKAALQAEDLGEGFFALWGNGMGGCELTGQGMDTYLPLTSLSRADVIAIQVPLTEDTRGMITSEFLGRCGREARIFCFLSREVVAQDVQSDSRIRYAVATIQDIS